ncbi:hypothetical protein TNCV_4926241 [Trichonephila clavipes]|nr:hypothetical protein TNCV_4926241 [Trichonephila clavipes]
MGCCHNHFVTKSNTRRAVDEEQSTLKLKRRGGETGPLGCLIKGQSLPFGWPCLALTYAWRPPFAKTFCAYNNDWRRKHPLIKENTIGTKYKFKEKVQRPVTASSESSAKAPETVD